MRRAKRLLPIFVVLLLLPLVGTHRAHADGAWLDSPLVNWNVVGMDVPQNPDLGGRRGNPNCASTARPPETDEDAAVTNAGWMLFGSYQAGWGVKIVMGTGDWDGMCRPADYQAFVFDDGVFAGTLSPEPMISRLDGSLVQTEIFDQGTEVSGSFNRYKDSDPLCCPSRTSFVSYSIDTSAGVPVLIPERVSTAPTGAG